MKEVVLVRVRMCPVFPAALWFTRYLTLQGCKEKITDWLADNALTIVAMDASIIILQVISRTHAKNEYS